MFFCLVGKVSDGHTFALSAYRRGCRFFVAERALDLPPDAAVFTVPDSRAAMADCAAEFYDHPERQMRLLGLTGTKGKTTTALLIQNLLLFYTTTTEILNNINLGLLQKQLSL